MCNCSDPVCNLGLSEYNWIKIHTNLKLGILKVFDMHVLHMSQREIISTRCKFNVLPKANQMPKKKISGSI